MQASPHSSCARPHCGPPAGTCSSKNANKGGCDFAPVRFGFNEYSLSTDSRGRLEQIADYATQVRGFLTNSMAIRDPLLAALAQPALPMDAESRLPIIKACLRANETRLINRFAPYRQLSYMANWLIDPANPPLPMPWNFPFQPELGIHTSNLMSESAVGLITPVTRQNAGSSLNGAAEPVAGVNAPCATACASWTTRRSCTSRR